MDGPLTTEGLRGKAPDARASILIVDDRPAQLLALQTILEELGQHIVVAHSGEEGLKRVLEHDFAVILLDVNMPGIDGLETAELIRGRKKSSHIPIIFVSADLNDDVHLLRGYSLGAVDYISTPVAPQVLRSKVKVFVDLYLFSQRERRRIEAEAALTQEKSARATAERAAYRAAFLGRASEVLARSLDFDVTVRHLAGLIVPELGDTGLLHLAPHSDDARTFVAFLAADATSELSVTRASLDETPWLARAIDQAVNEGKPVVVNDPVAGAYFDVRSLDHLGAVALPSRRKADALLLVPLSARGQVLGVLGLGRTGLGGASLVESVSTTLELAARASIALDNSMLFRRVQDNDKRKNEFLAMLAHELRNPLAPISNAVHLLEAQGLAPAQQQWAREVIRRQLDQLIRLVDDLLDVSRINSGKIDLRVDDSDALRAVDVAVETCRPQIEAMQHRLEVSVPPIPLRFRGDFARTAQVLGNLLGNACKYTEAGGSIAISAAADGDTVVFRVKDSGLGIPKEALGGIFELFTQLDRTLDRSHGGLGIGLTVVRRLVELQGGTVEAHSDGLNRGSEFVVRLPAAGAISATMAPAESAIVLTGGPLRVLVVDDNRDAAESTAAALRLAGHDVRTAFDGPSALAESFRYGPQVTLIDIGLPGMDGYEVVRQLRAKDGQAPGWIFAVSGYDSHEDRTRSSAAGFDDHFAKPLDSQRLTEMLAALVPREAAAVGEPVAAMPAR